MESADRARRRMYHLACQVGPRPSSEPRLRPGRSLSFAVCSAGGSSGTSRRDNRMLFARQGSDSQGQFMRQIVDADDRDDFRSPPLSALAPRTVTEDLGSTPKITRGTAEEGPSFAAVEPLFGKPAERSEPVEKHAAGTCGQMKKSDGPTSNRTSDASSQTKNSSGGSGFAENIEADAGMFKKSSPAAANQMCSDRFGFEWFPCMDIVESGSGYVITIELPGVSADAIRVEVVRGSLIVTGSRSNDWWKDSGNDSSGGSRVYHRRELAQGRYRAMWRLPQNCDINGITAEFIDGFLRILVPKIKVMTYL